MFFELTDGVAKVEALLGGPGLVGNVTERRDFPHQFISDVVRARIRAHCRDEQHEPDQTANSTRHDRVQTLSVFLRSSP